MKKPLSDIDVKQNLDILDAFSSKLLERIKDRLAGIIIKWIKLKLNLESEEERVNRLTLHMRSDLQLLCPLHML